MVPINKDNFFKGTRSSCWADPSNSTFPGTGLQVKATTPVNTNNFFGFMYQFKTQLI